MSYTNSLTNWNARIAEECKTAIKFGKESGMCSLRGSPKQEAWALTIRYKTFKQLLNLSGNTNAGKAIGAVLSLEHSAKWWIESRNFKPTYIFDTLVAKYPAEFKIVKITYTRDY